MKKIVKLLVMILFLIPFNVHAASAPELNKDYDNKTIIINLNDIGVDSSSLIENSEFLLHQVETNNSIYFHTYSLNSDINTYSSKVKSSDKSNVNLENKTELLNLLLSNVNQINKTNSEDIKDATVTEKLNMVATQILVWEIVKGERTSFNSIDSSSEYYKKLVSINRSNTISSGYPSLYSVYSNIVKTVNNSALKRSTNSKDNPFKLYYNAEKDRYQNIISTIDYDTLKSNYEIKNSTSIKLSSTSNGMLATIESGKYFTDVKSITLNQKVGSTNPDLENFYYFNGESSETYVLATKADKVPTEMYFTCAQGNFKILSLEGSGSTILGTTYNIKDKDGNLLKFSNIYGREFVYDPSSTTSITDIANNTSNTYIISDIPDGEYTIVQTKVPSGYSFSASEDNRTNKVKIENGKIYSYNKIIKKYELNAMHLVKFTNYASKVYIVQNSGLADDVTYTITNSKGEQINFAYSNSSGIYVPTESGITGLAMNSKAKNITIHNLEADSYEIKNNKTSEIRRFTVKNDGLVGDSILVSFDNKINEISFYKLDEEGNNLSGGSFSIREIDPNDEEKYVDLSLKKIDDNTYEIDENGEEFTFPIQDGKIIIKNAVKDKYYRIIELSPPDGYQLYDPNSSTVDIQMDSEGYTKGTPYLINKKIIISNDTSSNAELILSIRTGNEIIKYGIIGIIILSLVTSFIIIKRKAIKK